MSRETCAISALAAMKFYEPLFPGDHLPFQAIAAAIAVHNGERPVDTLYSLRKEVEKRRNDLQEIVGDYRLTRGYLVASLHAMTIVAICITEQTPGVTDVDDVESIRRQAVDMTTGVVLSLA